MHNKQNLILAFLMAASLSLTSCGGKSEKSSPKNQTQAQAASLKLEIPLPEEKPSRFPKQTKLSEYSETVTMTIKDESLVFDEHLSFEFEQDSSWWGGSATYNLKHIYLGNEDDSKFLFFGEEDDLTWSSPWKLISADLGTFFVYGGDSAGKGTPIGYIHRKGRNSFEIELFSDYEIDKENLSINFNEPNEIIIPETTTCPRPIELINASACSAYISLFNVLTSIDFSALGKVGKGVALDVVSFNTVSTVIKSFFTFEPDIDSIRENFLIPLLKSLKKVSVLDDLKRKHEEKIYLTHVQSAYSTLFVVSLDSVVKIQKMAPEAFENLNGIALGSALAYLGQESVGDAIISKDQPAWFTEVIAPIIRELGVLSIDLVLNGSGTPMQERIQRFSRMQTQVKNAIVRLCKDSKTANQNQCLNALK